MRKEFDSSKSGSVQGGELKKKQEENKGRRCTRKSKTCEKENNELRLHLTIAPDEEKEVDYEILDRKYPIKEWKIECLGTKPQADKAEHFEEINQNVVIRSNGQKRYFSTLMRVLSIFDREDLNVVYQLVMDIFQDEIPEVTYFVDDSPNVFNPPPQPPMYSCEFCGNDARYGHYCTPQVPFIYPK
ncbi:hypothetical protein Tco_0804368 [Tanacetum coccineum]|uniref:Uncharacterized protein n=1 Tax=Tanacetum coccineum TaxID=301880 RepID=A0ABQ5A504_9ASTR